jgi:GH24 family phage-related lysozyme (muramidase)
VKGEALEKAWRDQAGLAPLSPAMAFGPEGLTLGAGTVLASVDGLTEADERDEARLYALLSAAYLRPVAPQAIRYIRRGAASWRAGDEAMAAMHLAMTGLMPLRNVKDAARRLFMADALMKAGTGPDVILRALDLPGADGEDALTRYDPDQPRNPAGSGRVSGQWTREEAPAAAQESGAPPRQAAMPADSAAAPKPVAPRRQAEESSAAKPSQNASSRPESGRAASAETPPSTVESQRTVPQIRVDRTFIKKEEGRQATTGYVPKTTIKTPDGQNKNIFHPGSGVTIATGFDLHGRTVTSLQALGFDQDLIHRLKPYLSNKLVGNAAANVAHQLKISKREADNIDDAIFKATVSMIESNFDRDIKYAKFRQMPAEIQTALADLAYNFGPHLKSATPGLWRQIIAGDWNAVVTNLRTGFKGQKRRRRREAALIERALHRGNVPDHANPFVS